MHVVCAQVDDKFLQFSKSRGNDLSSPVGNQFPGLKAGDKWCLCAMRWHEAKQAGCAPLVDLNATNEKVLQYFSLSELVDHALDESQKEAAKRLVD